MKAEDLDEELDIPSLSLFAHEGAAIRAYQFFFEGLWVARTVGAWGEVDVIFDIDLTLVLVEALSGEVLPHDILIIGCHTPGRLFILHTRIRYMSIRWDDSEGMYLSHDTCVAAEFERA